MVVLPGITDAIRDVDPHNSLALFHLHGGTTLTFMKDIPLAGSESYI